MSVMSRSICRGDGAGLVVAVGDVGLGTLAGVELVEFLLHGGDFGFDVFPDAGGVLVDFDGHLFEARGDAGDGAAGGDGVLSAHAAEEVDGASGILGEVADVLVMAGTFVDDAVQPALAGPGLDQREPRLSVVEVFEVAFEPHDELGLGYGAVAEVALRPKRLQLHPRARRPEAA
jgi:hypothetical protein